MYMPNTYVNSKMSIAILKKFPETYIHHVDIMDPFIY